MEQSLRKANYFFDIPLNVKSRLLILAAIVLLPLVFLFPLYQMTMFSNQFPDGLRLYIYAYKLEGEKTPNRDDLREINSLNHYIGMRALDQRDFSEFIWIPISVGIFVLLGLRTVVIGKMVGLVDLIVLFAYFSLFSVWDFYYKLYTYGHTLDPTAAIKAAPFTPPLFGTKQIANFTIHHYPHLGSLFFGLFAMLLIAAIWIGRKPTIDIPGAIPKAS